MTANDKEVELEHVLCEVCLKEVPVDKAKNPETTDYIVHFCGLECYEQWMKQDENADEQAEKPDLKSAS